MVSDLQVRKLRSLDCQGVSKEKAAARSGIDPKTARKYRQLGRLPSEVKLKDRDWRTKPDPFAAVWAELKEMLTLNPGLEAKTLFQDLQRRCPGQFAAGQLRTLQRRVKEWRALSGSPKEVFFGQVHHPGQLCASDFTHCTSLRVTIAGVPFEHLLYHFVLTYSNWETGTVCFAESYESLSEGLQNALWELGGVPVLHRTDRLTAAVPPGTEGASFTERYQGLLRHYGLQGQAIQAGKGNENGDAEQSHRQFKRALEQALLLRGSRDFGSRREYERDFHLLKDRPLGIQPLFVREEEQILGLTRLLTIALRVLTLMELLIRSQLQARGEELSGLYEGQAKRTTGRPTAVRLLKAIARLEITLTYVEGSNEGSWQLTPLPPLLKRVLSLLGLSSKVYTRLVHNSG